MADKQILRGGVYSDDIAFWDGFKDLSEYDVPGTWLELCQGGRVIGRIKLEYDGDWAIQLDGGDQPFTVRLPPAEPGPPPRQG